MVGSYVGTGMHGGVMYLRGEVAEHQLGKEVRVLARRQRPTRPGSPRSSNDYCRVDGVSTRKKSLSKPFVKIYPVYLEAVRQTVRRISGVATPSP